MSFWRYRAWHDEVHRLLGESLFYFLARVRPFDSDDVKQRLDTLLSREQPGSVRAFAVFGSYDLLIRAWLHPNVSAQFQDWLKRDLIGLRTLYPFSVTKIEKRWFWGENVEAAVSPEALQDLDEEKIPAVQSGGEPELLSRLLRANLVIAREPFDEYIRFFVAINLENVTHELQESVVRNLKAYFAENVDLERASIYTGYGFCSILLKAEVKDFYSIPKLPNWIGKQFRALGASTETFLAHSPRELSGDESIGRATFKAIKGKNLFARSIIPEIYETAAGKADGIEAFLVAKVHGRELRPKDKKLLHDYLLACLHDNAAEMARTVFTFFAELENFLRKKHGEYIGRRSLNMTGLFEELKINRESDRFLSLGPALDLCSLAAARAGGVPPKPSGWGSLVKLRNEIGHGEIDVLRNWQYPAETIVEYSSKIRWLIDDMESVVESAEQGDAPIRLYL
jgi:hypothetical protein